MIESVVSKHATCLHPVPTDAQPQLPKLAGIRAVLFDVYGTLLVSGSGDVGLTSKGDRWQCANDAAEAIGIDLPDDPRKLGDGLLAEIDREHARLKAKGVDFPEVRIEELWRRLLPDCDVERLAIEYEMRINPVWPMPGLAETLETIRERGLKLGIVSNAQFFTPRLFEPLTERTLDDFGFDPTLGFWSYEHRRAKPGTFLYERAAEALAEHKVAPTETLYVGNDMRNDVWPASRVGLQTALFAGDARSLRLREDDADVSDITPDAVVTDLRQIIDIVSP